ncbi:hypothetical protein C8R46DRAFT_1058694 [Mycena filopes]|nr:hypothetical protein C8R46DRAFT_1058694 [Mycena filopes]
MFNNHGFPSMNANHFGQHQQQDTTTSSTTSTTTHTVSQTHTDMSSNMHANMGMHSPPPALQAPPPVAQIQMQPDLGHDSSYFYYRLYTRDSDPLNSALAFQDGDPSLGRVPRQRLHISSGVQQHQLLNVSQLTHALSKFEGNNEPIRTAAVHKDGGPMHAGDKVPEWMGRSAESAVAVVVGMSATQAALYWGGADASAKMQAEGGKGFNPSPMVVAGTAPRQPTAEESKAMEAQMAQFQQGRPLF